jgi:hypothetical protein
METSTYRKISKKKTTTSFWRTSQSIIGALAKFLFYLVFNKDQDQLLVVPEHVSGEGDQTEEAKAHEPLESVNDPGRDGRETVVLAPMMRRGRFDSGQEEVGRRGALQRLVDGLGLHTQVSLRRTSLATCGHY